MTAIRTVRWGVVTGLVTVALVVPTSTIRSRNVAGGTSPRTTRW